MHAQYSDNDGRHLYLVLDAFSARRFFFKRARRRYQTSKELNALLWPVKRDDPSLLKRSKINGPGLVPDCLSVKAFSSLYKTNKKGIESHAEQRKIAPLQHHCILEMLLRSDQHKNQTLNFQVAFEKCGQSL